jgi:hypothetical protein
MKSTYGRRYRRSASPSRESATPKKDSQQEQAFFAGPSEQSFFKPNIAIQRKCDHCEAEEKKAQRMAGPKEEEKKVQKMGDKKEEEIHREPEKKEEVIHKMEDKKEDKELHRAAEAKEEDKIHKMNDKKEEEIHREPEKKEEVIHKMEDKKEDNEIHRETEKKEEKSIAKKDSNSSISNGIAATGTYIQSLNGKGSPLPKDTQHFFGKRMSYDFSNVKIHTGTEAEQSAKNVNAKAYAVDNNIVFNKGQYNPTSVEGKKLLAHELTHVIQQNEHEPEILNRVAENTGGGQAQQPGSFIMSGHATNTHNKRAYGCEGVNVQGHTDANYTDSFTSSGTTKPSSKCTECDPADCVDASGFIVSAFNANPAITLPSVPDGLSDCENTALTKFINTTLNNHEKKHVAAFNTYNATIKTPYKFTGCHADMDGYIQSLHDAINTKKMAASNSRSDALDPFSPAIPCDCKDQ